MVSLDYLAFEVTRRCNEGCKMCMRGNPEEVDMTKDIVDKVLLNNYIMDISTIMFSGGEPTLNENLICYIIEQIMKYNILVYGFSMVTNGKKYPQQILEALNDYQKYCVHKGIKSSIKINFSVDPFHEYYPDVIKMYKEKYPQFKYDFKGLDLVWKTGRAEYGEEFRYNIDPVLVQVVMGYLWIANTIYITAKGNYETVGDGAYLDMDKLNMGSVFDNSILDIIKRYGKLTYGSEEDFKRLVYKPRAKL